ncbi:MAG: hypothetical protein J6P90_02675 [Rikenellaceae bacterium]|nr:hypothetical protein [Rikenellaceae bacterium]
MEYNDFKEWGVAERAMCSYAEECRAERVNVRLHEPRMTQGWQRVALALAMVTLVVGVAWLARPQVYGYVNGEPIYSLAEAEREAEQIMANLAQGGVGEENLLQSLFTIE